LIVPGPLSNQLTHAAAQRGYQSLPGLPWAEGNDVRRQRRFDLVPVPVRQQLAARLEWLAEGRTLAQQVANELAGRAKVLYADYDTGETVEIPPTV